LRTFLEREVRRKSKVVPEVSVNLTNVPGQFSRVLKALATAQVNIRGFSVDQTGAISELRLLFTDAPEAERAEKALREYQYETSMRQLLVLSRPDMPGELLKVAEVLGDNSINIEYCYVALGQTETGEVLLAFRVSKGKAQLAADSLSAQGIQDHDRIPDWHSKS
jgi:hypothetical protein